jgi:hypothetical protein
MRRVTAWLCFCVRYALQSHWEGGKDVEHRDPRLTSPDFWNQVCVLDTVTLTRLDGFLFKLKGLPTGPTPVSVCAGQAPPVSRPDFNVRMGFRAATLAVVW